MKLSHILVRHLYEAQDLEKKLLEGQSFSELARKYSTCSSASAGGSLGDLTGKLNRLDSEFREAAEMLKPGQSSKPIRTKFGYHIILRES